MCSAHVALIPRCILRLGVQMKVSLVFALHLFANYKGQLSFWWFGVISLVSSSHARAHLGVTRSLNFSENRLRRTLFECIPPMRVVLIQNHRLAKFQCCPPGPHQVAGQAFLALCTQVQNETVLFKNYLISRFQKKRVVMALYGQFKVMLSNPKLFWHIKKLILKDHVFL